MEKIAKGFGVGASAATSKDYLGSVIVTNDAIYFVATGAVGAAQAGVAFGAAGVALGAAVDKLHQKIGPKEPAWEAVSALPPDVARHPSLRDVRPDCRFISIGKEDVKALRFSFLAGVKIVGSALTVTLQIMPWEVGKARRAFQGHGWSQARA
jgi:hypothetical protein